MTKEEFQWVNNKLLDIGRASPNHAMFSCCYSNAVDQAFDPASPISGTIRNGQWLWLNYCFCISCLFFSSHPFRNVIVDLDVVREIGEDHVSEWTALFTCGSQHHDEFGRCSQYICSIFSPCKERNCKGQYQYRLDY